MRYKLFGNSGLRVIELALGPMTLGEDWGWGASKEESRKIFDVYVNAGGNFIDTSVNCTNGTAESFVGDFVASDRDHFVVATKYTLARRQGDPNAAGNHRKNMMSSVETSLRHLKTEYIDVLWLHAWDYTTPIEEVLRGLDDLVRQGKVLYIGISDSPAWVVSAANVMSELRGWSRFVALQVRYNLADREIERDLLPMAEAFGLAVTPWSVLGAGTLTGKYCRATSEPRRNRSARDKQLQLAETMTAIVGEIGRTPSQVAINWVGQQTSKAYPIIPILGARSDAHIKGNLGCLDFELSAEHLKRLDDASPIDLGLPHELLASEVSAISSSPETIPRSTPAILDFTSPVVYHDTAMKLSVSILSSDFTRFGEQIAECEAGGADWIHLDVMDGHFVPNITLGPLIVEAARRATRLPLDVHLMIEEPDRYLPAFAQAGADCITVHVEACRHLHRTIQQIKELGRRAGVAINPATPPSAVTEILNDVDLVLAMTVNPGFSGQVFIPAVISKVRKLRQWADAARPVGELVDIEVDGGIDSQTAPLVVEAGASVLVAATAVFKTGLPIAESIRRLRHSVAARSEHATA